MIGVEFHDGLVYLRVWIEQPRESEGKVYIRLDFFCDDLRRASYYVPIDGPILE